MRESDKESRLSGWRGRAVALALGLSLMGGFEALLHLFPGFAPPPLSREVVADESRTLRTLNPTYPRRFFSGSIGQWSLGGVRLDAQSYVEPRPENGVRVVCVGGSTMQGYPHPRRLATASLLQVMLQRAWPERQVEVINAGVTSIASFAVAKVVEHALDLDPDLVVVYTGHNEFYGVYGAAALRSGGGSAPLKELHYAAMQWRTTALLRYCMGRFAAQTSPDISLLAALGAAGSVAPNDPRRQRARQNLQHNLRRIARLCQGRDIPVVFCTLASNETGFAPFGALDQVEVPAGQGEQWRHLMAVARGRLEEDTTAAGARQALEHLEEAAEIFDNFALLHFWRGRALERSGQFAAAWKAYGRARDLDPMPWRAPEAFNETVREAALAAGIPLAEVAAAFRRASPAAGVGWNLMVDHLHPGFEGQYLLARSVFRALRQAPAAVSLSEEQMARAPEAGELGAELGNLPAERAAVARAMAHLLAAPPLVDNNRKEAARLRARAEDLWSGLSQAERAGLEKWEKSNKGAPLALMVADQYFAAEDLASALPYYGAARREAPYTVLGDLWSTLRWARCLHYVNGRLREEERAVLQETSERAQFLARDPDFDREFLRFFDNYANRLLQQ